MNNITCGGPPAKVAFTSAFYCLDIFGYTVDGVFRYRLEVNEVVLVVCYGMISATVHLD